MSKRDELAIIAMSNAQRCFHGNVMGLKSNIAPIIDLFPKWSLENWDNIWCAAFVYYCCIEAGFNLPVKYPDESVPNNFAGCNAWEAWAKLSINQFYYSSDIEKFIPAKGDLVLYDEVFTNSPHDHIGIIIENKMDTIVVAEGNIGNVSGVVERVKDRHIRGYIRIPSDYQFTDIKI